EEALDECLRERFGSSFRHNEHSLRVVDTLERDGHGLNLTTTVRDGIVGHSGRAEEPSTMEGRIVRLVDGLAYTNHDIDDALRAGVLAPGDLPVEEIELLGDSGSARIDTLVHDLVETSETAGDIVQSRAIRDAMLSLRGYMFEHVYLAPHAAAEPQPPRVRFRRDRAHRRVGLGRATEVALEQGKRRGRPARLARDRPDHLQQPLAEPEPVGDPREVGQRAVTTRARPLATGDHLSRP